MTKRMTKLMTMLAAVLLLGACSSPTAPAPANLSDYAIGWPNANPSGGARLGEYAFGGPEPTRSAPGARKDDYILILAGGAAPLP